MAQNTGTVSSVAASATAVTLFAASGGIDVVQRTVTNDSTATLYLKFGSGASTASYTVQIPAGGYYEVPHPVFDGLITGIWSSATGAALCTQVDL